MILGTLAVLSLLCAAIPAALFCLNLNRYRIPPPPAPGTPLPEISVLIPARDEERSIEACVRSILTASKVAFEIIVMDDASTDRTASIVQSLAQEDPRVRLKQAPPLPPGWNGKQHACWALAAAARYDILCFIDADVRLDPEALTAMAAFLTSGDNALVSGFPQQLTSTFMEWLLLPLIHFVLLGFLPLSRMRATTDPAFAAGCGQFIMVRRDPYFAAGGHSAIRATMHDGLLLPRLLRRHGHRTDLADLTPYATCRMYTSASQVWNGLAKNATEGIANPVRIVPISAILFLGQVFPFLVVFSPVYFPRWIGLSALLAMCLAWLPRLLGIPRFRQDWRGALLHPLGIVLLLAIQWYALLRKLSGSAVTWKTRAYSGE